MYRDGPPENDKERIEDLIHLYIDGAFDRRELLKRVAVYTGSIAAATAAFDRNDLLEFDIVLVFLDSVNSKTRWYTVSTRSCSSGIPVSVPFRRVIH